MPGSARRRLQHEHLASACLLIYANKQAGAGAGGGRAGGRAGVAGLPPASPRRPRLGIPPGHIPAWRPPALLLTLPRPPHLHVRARALWQDLAGAMGVPELSEGLDLVGLKSHNWHVQASCALTGEGLLEGLQWVAEELRRKEAAPLAQPQPPQQAAQQHAPAQQQQQAAVAGAAAAAGAARPLAAAPAPQ